MKTREEWVCDTNVSMCCNSWWVWCLTTQGQTGSHSEHSPVLPPLPNKCDWEVDPSELDFSNSVCIGKVFSTFSWSRWHCTLSRSYFEFLNLHCIYCGRVVSMKLCLRRIDWMWVWNCCLYHILYRMWIQLVEASMVNVHDDNLVIYYF